MWLAVDVTVMVEKTCPLAKQPRKWEEVCYIANDTYGVPTYAPKAGSPTADVIGQ